MNLGSKHKILIVDDHQLFIDGIRALLLDINADFYTALTAQNALTLIEEHDSFDLILLDIKMPGISGLSLLKKLKSVKNISPTLVISADETPRSIQEALTQGALGFVSKESNSAVLRLAINTVMQGETYLSPMWHYLLEAKATDEEKLQGITSRQLEILHLVAQGMANKVISVDLGISENTVKAHIHAIFKLLNVTNRMNCIQQAKNLGII